MVTWVMCAGDVDDVCRSHKQLKLESLLEGSLLGVRDGLLHVRSRVKLSMENREKGC